MPQDYGEDLLVEVVSGEFLTGLAFGVQLKGTGVRTRSTAMVVRDIRWDHVRRWSSLAMPILVVRYLAESEQLYGYWAHEHGWRDGRDESTPKPRFRFQDSDELTPERVAALPQEVARFRTAQRDTLNLPSRISCRSDVQPRQIADLRRGLRELLNHSFSFTQDRPEPGDVELILSSGQVMVTFGGWSSSTCWASDAMPDLIAEADHLPYLVTALLMRTLHPGTPGALRCAEALVDAEAWVLLEVPFPLVVAAVARSSGRSDLGVRVAKALLPIQPTLATVVARMSIGSLGSDTDIDELEAICRTALDLADGRGKGECAYNLANLLRSQARYTEAVDAYDEVVRWEPDYRHRAYWWTERGGALFECWRFDEAFASYQAGLALLDDPDPESLALAADAGLHAGDLVAARSLAERSLEQGGHRLSTVMIAALDQLEALESGEERELALRSPDRWIAGLTGELNGRQMLLPYYLRRDKLLLGVLALSGLVESEQDQEVFAELVRLLDFHASGCLEEGFHDDYATLERLGMPDDLRDAVGAGIRQVLDQSAPEHRPFVVRGATGDGQIVSVEMRLED